MWCLCTILSVLKGFFYCKQTDVACPFYLVYDAAGTPVEERVPAEIFDFRSDGLRLSQPARQPHLQMILGSSAYICSRPRETQKLLSMHISITIPYVQVMFTMYIYASPPVLRTYYVHLAFCLWDDSVSPTPHCTGCFHYLALSPGSHRTPCTESRAQTHQ